MSRRQGTSTLSPLIWLAVVILILYFARAVLIPLALALTLNFLLAPMVTWLQRLRMSRVLAVAVVMLVSAAVVGEMGWVVSGQLLQVASNLPKYRQNIRNKIEALHLAPESALGRAAVSVKEIDAEFVESPTTRPAQTGPQAPATLKAGAPQVDSTVPTIPVQIITPPATGLRYLGQLLSPRSGEHPTALPTWPAGAGNAETWRAAGGLDGPDDPGTNHHASGYRLAISRPAVEPAAQAARDRRHGDHFHRVYSH